MKWSIVYEGAFNQDKTLYFPERLTLEFLEQQRKTQGIYMFTNQYLNQVIPDDEQDFKKQWLKNYSQLPNENLFTFIFIDPAIALTDGADYTATVVVHVDPDKNWYVDMAYRQRITATQTLDWIFRLNEMYKPMCIGVEDVAYQKALLHFAVEEMQKRNQMIPLKGIKRSTASKDGTKNASPSKPFRIRSLVPRFEFGKIFLNAGLDDFILEYSTFPRGSHDDLLDALSSIEEIVTYPDKRQEQYNVTNPADPRYERHFIRRLHREASRARETAEGDE